MSRMIQTCGLALVCLLAVAGCGFDEPPEQQAANFLAAIKPGMTWEQVIAVKAPRKWAVVDGEAMGGHKQMQDFSDAAIRDGLKNGIITDGFVFQYRFHEDHAYQLWFDQAGKMVEATKMPSMKDLMN